MTSYYNIEKKERDFLGKSGRIEWKETEERLSTFFSYKSCDLSLFLVYFPYIYGSSHLSMDIFIERYYHHLPI